MDLFNIKTEMQNADKRCIDKLYLPLQGKASSLQNRDLPSTTWWEKRLADKNITSRRNGAWWPMSST